MRPTLPTFPEQLPALEGFQAPGAVPELADYADLADVLDTAERQGVVDAPAADKEAALRGDANLVREQIIAERLWLLGYLEDANDLASSRRNAERRRFLRAVADFQRGAGLVVDQWSGEQTWQALQDLITFESPIDIARYIRQGRPLPALARATRLRLWSLGLMNRKPGKSDTFDTLPGKALRAFWEMCGRFKLVDLLEEPPDTTALLRHLFDLDALAEAVAEIGKLQTVGGRERWVFAYIKRSSETRRQVDPQVECFLACLAKVELWLLGFDVDITHNRNYPVYNFRERTSNRNRKMAAALEQFWDTVDPVGAGAAEGLSDRERRRREKDRERLGDYITPELFKALADPALSSTSVHPEPARQRASSAEAFSREDYSREVAEELTSQEEIEATWSKGKRLGMKLWDGVRRIWRWLRLGLTKILDIGRNLVRAFFRYSTKAFEIVRRAFTAVTESLAQYNRGEIETGSNVQLLLARDGDIRATLPPGTAAMEVTTGTQRLQYFGAAFQLSCSIVAAIMRVVRTAVTGAVGWARLLWLLVRSYRDIRPLYRQLQALPAPASLAA